VEEGASVATPAQVDVWAGLDVGKGEHFADVLDDDGERLFARAVAARRGMPMAYVPGLVMRRAADLYPGEAKTDRRDAYVPADTGRTRRKQVHWLDASSDELLAQLRVLNGFDIDLAADVTRLAMLRTGQPCQPARPAPSLAEAA
jgi:Transposase